MKNSVPRVLYHYCSLTTFKSIFDNKSIWLSDIRKSNDSMELQWIMGQCQYYMMRAWVEYVHSVQNERGMDIVTSEHFDSFEKLYRLIEKYDAEDDAKNWVFCLSQKADDLGQWRGYADDGQGIAIGFNTSTLKNIDRIGDKIRSTSVQFQFDKVRYSRKEIEHLFSSIAGLSKINVNMSPDEVIQYIKYAVGLSYMYAPFYKSDKFKEEKEWRVVYSMYFGDLEKGNRPGVSNEDNVFSDQLTLENYAFTQKGTTLVSHLEMGLPQIKRAIHSITIGPKANVSPMDIRLYLMSIGILDDVDDTSIKIVRSNISYR